VSAIEINGRRIGSGEPTYVIAELSANHNQDFDEAIKLVAAAKSAGADAVKLQTYTADTITIDSDREWFQIRGTLWDKRNLYDLYKEAYTPWEWHGDLIREANRLGMDCFSSPFDHSAVDFLESLGVPAFKIASFENVDIPLLQRVAATGKPVIMSTGMATLAEIEEAVTTLRAAGCSNLALLKCTSAYPALPEEMNLRTIPHLAEMFGAPVGLSDHTLGVAVPVAAIALGACIVEKHFTLSRSVPGPDAAFSLEPDEFKAMVDAIRVAERALGGVSYCVSEGERASRMYRRSLFVVEDVRKGEPFTERNIRSIRPAHGLHTRHLTEILGRRATRDLERGEPLQWEMSANDPA
jgi:N-acetylneuraminate synthase